MIAWGVFDHDQMLAFCRGAIADFAAVHGDETFYAFSIDASLLCLNSEETLVATYTEMEKRGGPLGPREREEIRTNTGDWAYQGFADLTEEHGFDEDAYQVHYDAPDHAQRSTAYAMAMDRLVRALVEVDAFGCLRTSEDFVAHRVEHDY